MARSLPRAVLRIPFDHEVRQPAQMLGARSELREGLERVCVQLAAARLGRRHPGDTRIRGLVLGAIRARRLAERGGVALDVEHVVLDLESEPEVERKTIETRKALRICFAGSQRA